MNIALIAALLAVPATSPIGHSSEGSTGQLKAKLLIVDDVDAFWKAWEGPTPPHIATTSTVTLKRPVYAMIVFGGCAPAADGNCNLSVTYRIVAPNGSQYDEPVSGEAWKGPPAPVPNLQASLASIGFRLEPQDALGDYVIQAELTDGVAISKLTISEIVTAKGN